mgnify:CR=1 FL=1
MIAHIKACRFLACRPTSSQTASGLCKANEPGHCTMLLTITKLTRFWQFEFAAQVDKVLIPKSQAKGPALWRSVGLLLSEAGCACGRQFHGRDPCLRAAGAFPTRVIALLARQRSGLGEPDFDQRWQAFHFFSFTQAPSSLLVGRGKG